MRLTRLCARFALCASIAGQARREPLRGRGLGGGAPNPALGLLGTAVHTECFGRTQGAPTPCNMTLFDALLYVIGL